MVWGALVEWAERGAAGGDGGGPAAAGNAPASR